MEVTTTENESELVLEFTDAEYEDYNLKKKSICEASGIDIDELSDDVLILSLIDKSLDELNDEDFYEVLRKKIEEGI